MATKKTWMKGIPLEDDAQHRLRSLIKEKGDEKKAAEFIGVGQVSVVRAAAGLGLRRGTAHMIKMALGMTQVRATG